MNGLNISVKVNVKNDFKKKTNKQTKEGKNRENMIRQVKKTEPYISSGFTLVCWKKLHPEIVKKEKHIYSYKNKIKYNVRIEYKYKNEN